MNEDLLENEIKLTVFQRLVLVTDRLSFGAKSSRLSLRHVFASLPPTPHSFGMAPSGAHPSNIVSSMPSISKHDHLRAEEYLVYV